MSVIQILLIIFFLVAIAKAVARYRAGELGGGGLLVWVLFWLVAAGAVAIPNATFYFARFLGVGRGADLVVYVSLAILFFVVFKILIAQKRLERNLTKLVRSEALKEGEKK